MKKTAKLMLGMLLAVTMLVMTGCTKQTTVEFTLDGIDVTAVVPGVTQNIANYSVFDDPNGTEPTKYTITVKTDGEYSILLVDKNEKEYSLVLKLQNGKAEFEAPDGIIVHSTVK